MGAGPFAICDTAHQTCRQWRWIEVGLLASNCGRANQDVLLSNNKYALILGYKGQTYIYILEDDVRMLRLKNWLSNNWVYSLRSESLVG